MSGAVNIVARRWTCPPSRVNVDCTSRHGPGQHGCKGSRRRGGSHCKTEQHKRSSWTETRKPRLLREQDIARPGKGNLRAGGVQVRTKQTSKLCQKFVFQHCVLQNFLKKPRYRSAGAVWAPSKCAACADTDTCVQAQTFYLARRLASKKNSTQVQIYIYFFSPNGP